MRRNYIPKRLAGNIKCVIIALLLILTYFVLSYNLNHTKSNNSEEATNDVSHHSVLNLPNVIVHLDMKGSPPKLSYLKSLLPKLLELGATGLLIEYEDMFPYENMLVNISAKSCYEKAMLRDFLRTAVQLELDIIPLVQTFGHMEHVLKLEEFQHLREVSISPESICPSRSASRVLIEEMLRQVIKFHQNIFPLKYIHIGCDEVLNLNKCEHCSKRKLTESAIYLNHLKFVRETVKTINPNIAVLAWDDMLRDIPASVWKKIDNHIEPVYWDYTPNVKVSHISLMHYHDKFKKIWIASAFKGAESRVAPYPNMKKRFLNHFSWLKLILDYKFGGENEIFTFEGIIITGWSRYSHMDPLCELLPVSIPSLVLNLLLIKQFKQGVNINEIQDDTAFYNKYFSRSFSKYLICNNLVDLDYFDTSQCDFDGNEVYQALLKWDVVNTNILSTLNNYDSDLFGLDFLYEGKYIYMPRLKFYIEWCHRALSEIASAKKSLANALSIYYNKNDVDYYIDFKTNNTKNLLSELLVGLNNKFISRTWKRRP